MTSTTSAQDFEALYKESRNGANNFFRNPLVPKFFFSDGVKDCADAAGCYWLLDIVATECLEPLGASKRSYMGIVTCKVSAGQADITLTDSDEAAPIWSRHLDFTDMPEGEWKFILYNDIGNGSRFSFILPSEY
jgi:hypothetical protein